MVGEYGPGTMWKFRDRTAHLLSSISMYNTRKSNFKIAISCQDVNPSDKRQFFLFFFFQPGSDCTEESV